MSLYIHNRFVNSRTVQARDKAWLKVLSYEICDSYTHTHTHILNLLKFLLLANSHHALGVPHHPGNTLAQAKLLGHVSFTDKVSADHKAKNGH